MHRLVLRMGFVFVAVAFLSLAYAKGQKGKYADYLKCYSSLSSRLHLPKLELKKGTNVAVLSGEMAVRGKGNQNAFYIFTEKTCYAVPLADRSYLEFELREKKGAEYFSYELFDEELGPDFMALDRPSKPNPIRLSSGDIASDKSASHLMKKELLRKIPKLFPVYESERLLVAKDPKRKFLDILNSCAGVQDKEIQKLVALEKKRYASGSKSDKAKPHQPKSENSSKSSEVK